MKCKPLFTLVAPVLLLTACSSADSDERAKREAINEYEKSTQQVSIRAAKNATEQEDIQFQTLNSPLSVSSSEQTKVPTVKNINYYVQALAQDMMANLNIDAQGQSMAVASFVFLDTDYQRGTLLGNQLSEGFIHELHEFGVEVVDYKMTDYIRVTEQGDFTFSRDFLELRQNHPMQYVLGGTLVHHRGGVLVNARIVGVQSKRVMATSQGFIPADVVNALVSRSHGYGVALTSGNKS